MHCSSLKQVLFIILVMVCCTSTRAQDAFRKFKVTTWDTRSGMPNDLALNLYQSLDGFIWITGYSGLTRFDGVEFATFNSRSDSVFRSDVISSPLLETEDSALWIATPGNGLIRYKKGKFQRFADGKTTLFGLGKTNDGHLLPSSLPNPPVQELGLD